MSQNKAQSFEDKITERLKLNSSMQSYRPVINTIRINRIYGDILPRDDSKFIEKLSRQYKNKEYYFEKKKNENLNKWFLNIKNLNEIFNITEYYETVKKRSNFDNCIVRFPQKNVIGGQEDEKFLSIETVFYIVMGKNTITRGDTTKISKESYKKKLTIKGISENLGDHSKESKNILIKLLKLFDGSLVNEFYRKRVSYEATVSSEVGSIGIDLIIRNCGDRINVKNLHEVIHFWRLDNSGSYTRNFSTYTVYAKNNNLIIQLESSYKFRQRVPKSKKDNVKRLKI